MVLLPHYYHLKEIVDPDHAITLEQNELIYDIVPKIIGQFDGQLFSESKAGFFLIFNVPLLHDI